MNKNAYEIRLDVLLDAHRYCTELFQTKLVTLGEKPSVKDIENLYPTKKEILETAELFYEFVSNSHK
jgi:hypothetical protein